MSLARWLTASWFLGLLVAIPLYHPYPRLTLPWLVVAWIGVGAFWGERQSTKKLRPVVSWGFGAAVVMAGGLILWGRGDSSPAWEDRRVFVETAAQIINEAPQDAIISVVNEPGIFFHLALSAQRRSDVAVIPIAELSQIRPASTDAPIFVVTGLHAEQDLNDVPLGVHLKPTGHWSYQPSTLVRLNRTDPARLRSDESALPASVRLFEVLAQPQSPGASSPDSN